MTEKELLEKIKSSAEEIEVPECLLPEMIKIPIGKKNKKQHWYAGRKIATVALGFFVCMTGIFVTYQFWGNETEGNTRDVGVDMAQVAEECAEMTEKTAHVSKSDAGELYVVADDYSEVYDSLKEQQENRWDLCFSADGAEAEVAGSAQIDAGEVEENYQECSLPASSDTSREFYSKTNVQTIGVDESDRIKTDGAYLYIVDEDVLKIIDIRDADMKETAEIQVTSGSAADDIVEMYVNEDTLNLIVEREETALETEENQSVTDRAICDVYHMNTNIKTKLLTYDISNRRKPVLKGSVEQDGFYKTSRKVGDMVYLFSEKEIEIPNLTKKQATKEDEIESWIPFVDEEPIAADCIYLPQEGNNGLIVSSIDLTKPDFVVDNMMILNNYVNIYVSTEAIYLYGQNYSGKTVSTEIAKFRFKDGKLDAVGATSVAGEVYDTFAINEHEGKLRILTTDWSDGEQKNQLYLLDEKLNLTGSLKGIAKGEQIYAARYLGNRVYFVTYQNTDPLFAVDLSDEKNPKILAELKITGFSEYLHFWGDDKLVGIGYETDAKTGEQKGIKLSMFDISKEEHLATLGTCVMKDFDGSPALYNYKCVLADAGENLIGFVAEDYENSTKNSYLLFSWEDGAFRSLLSEKLDSDEMVDGYRGIYVADRFYLANSRSVTCYDRTREYKKLGTLEW